MFIFWPFTNLLVKTTAFLERKITQTAPELTPEELSFAIDITANEADARQEKDILKGIVNITQTHVTQIMKPRMDVYALDDSFDFTEVLNQFRSLRFSRMPVYHENLDHITGILNMKDLMQHLNENEKFEWQKLQRPAHFVPENKKIDDLLHEFRQSRNHMAIVVDEFGGSGGIVTLEDILEEVFGEIQDEFDEENLQYSRLGENKYLFEGKTLLVDFLRITQLPLQYFDAVNGEIDTLGGLITELAGTIPAVGEEIFFNHISFTIDASDMRRILRIKVEIKLPETNND
jgi:gliding motility-associated protein GldE